jgi:hypothetical protein
VCFGELAKAVCNAVGLDLVAFAIFGFDAWEFDQNGEGVGVSKKLLE